MKNSSYYDFQKTFLHGIRARDIAEPLKSFDSDAPAGRVKTTMQEHGIFIASIREEAELVGYIYRHELGDNRLNVRKPGSPGQHWLAVIDPTSFPKCYPIPS